MFACTKISLFSNFFFFSIKSIDIESSIGKRFTRARYPGELITLILRRKSFGGKKIKKKKKKQIKIGKNIGVATGALKDNFTEYF